MTNRENLLKYVKCTRESFGYSLEDQYLSLPSSIASAEETFSSVPSMSSTNHQQTNLGTNKKGAGCDHKDSGQGSATHAFYAFLCFSFIIE